MMGWRFEPGEALRHAFRRVAAEEIGKIRAALTATDTDRAKAIHEARQGFKRLRALARLARPSLGSAFAAENHRWRDAGQWLAGSRDRTVLIQTFDKLVADPDAELGAPEIACLRARIAGNEPEPTTAETDANVLRVLEMLAAADTEAARLPWPKSATALRRGLHKSQARLRKSWKAAHSEPSPEALHRWRKRVKDQAAQLRLFRRVASNGLRAIRNDEKDVAERLGEEHDLWLLWRRLSDEAIPPDGEAGRDLLLKKIEERRAELRLEAFAKGDQFSARRAKEFAETLGDSWDGAAARAARKARRKERRMATAAID